MENQGLIPEKYLLDIMDRRDENGCWNVLKQGDKHFPEMNYYVPVYSSTLWTLILLADMGLDPNDARIKKPMASLLSHLYDGTNGIFSLGKTHFPIPCLNGNMLYLLSYFGLHKKEVLDKVVDFFAKYQRFDDGDFKTPSKFPYFSNKSCYGAHTCYWGAVKLLKGLSFIPKESRSKNARKLLDDCIDYILLHEVCFGSRQKDHFLSSNIGNLSFPNMYKSDFLEILWLLKREKVCSSKMDRALELLREKRLPDRSWKIEKPIKDLVVPLGNRNGGAVMITRRAQEVIDYYFGKELE